MRTVRVLVGALVAGWLGMSAGKVAAQDARPLGPLQSLTMETGRSQDSSFTLAGREAWQQLVVTGRYATGLRDLTGAVVYETVPPGVVAVDVSGLVTPLKEGQAVVRAKAPGGFTAEVKVTVSHFDQ